MRSRRRHPARPPLWTTFYLPEALCSLRYVPRRFELARSTLSPPNYIGQGNAAGERVPFDEAEDKVFGVGLLNDWSARDIQVWEQAPLGPFLAKNFATSVFPWIVTLEALAPFRAAVSRPDGDSPPLPYLDSDRNRTSGGFDIVLEVRLGTARQRAAGRSPRRGRQDSFVCHRQPAGRADHDHTRPRRRPQRPDQSRDLPNVDGRSSPGL